MSLNGQKVLVLNRAYLATNIIGWRRAITLLYGGKAEMVNVCDDVRIRTVDRDYSTPSVIRLLFYSGFPRFTPRFTRRNVYLRDDYTCQYCGKKSETGGLNLDHVVPLSRKGTSGWMNVVCSCIRCNLKKKDNHPSEVGMKLLRAPRVPGNYMLYRIRCMLEVPVNWDDYLYWNKKRREPLRKG